MWYHQYMEVQRLENVKELTNLLKALSDKHNLISYSDLF